ncbi:hypothetical protein GCM10012275_06610 [Longimycelium tulufanense]|uniref:Fumarylacetoacetase-like C-terminal domain-containing protein n=1 Tax=Longimycelium tulufanense TaxID=907463 RepID=A0A8J3C9A7_9PSEU|nr:fumarylacetoacetate hydrolase family protein [Longimycelium tulufanense]GGM38270.1 hypothetical protein GCM10012275_06610 [Longimycelium tulufanense]
MRLVTFERGAGPVGFGAVVGDVVVDFADAARARTGAVPPRLASVDAYLRGLPASLEEAHQLLAGVVEADGRRVESVRLLPPVPRPAALLDCTLTPRHVANSTATLLRRSLPSGVGRVAGWVAKPVLGRRPRGVRYYKGNHNAMIGDHDTIGWPAYTAYLDIEPELAVVTGAVPCGATRAQAVERLAGYLIFNDASARDVQLPEMFFTGPASSKDFDDSNGLGPYLVTPDDVADPLALDVTVGISDRGTWVGTTADYAMHPIDAVVAIASRRSLAAGTVIGMGTIPDCCGLDRDEWLRPNDQITITFDGLGTLHQRVGTPTTPPGTRWQRRSDLAPAPRG